jgi:HAE1 family hydrophobic/amphiphilic exporter-1
MIEFFVKRPITTIMFVCVFVVLGIASFSTLSIERTPKVDLPIVTVSVQYPGATPLEVETLVIKKIEDAVSELSEIDKIRSQSYEGFGYIFIEFLMSADVNVKSIEVKDKVEAILNDLPKDIEKPVIEKFDPLVESVMDLVLSSDTVDERDLYEYADKTLKTKLASVKGVAKIDVYGGKERQINARLDPMLMKQHYITIADVIAAMQAKSINIPGGLLEKDLSSLSVRFVGEFQSVDEIKNMMLTSQDGAQFPLHEIAIVEDSFKKVETIARYNGKDVVGLSLYKVSDGNAADIAREVRRRFGEFRAFLPEGMRLEIASDTTTFVVNETHDTLINILIGILLTVIILFLFTGQAKLTFIAAIVIPTSLISAFSLMSASGFTINMMTLLAIATSLGTLIANAIVIIENVLVHLEHKETPVHAAIDGTKEVSGAVMAATGTNLVVFMPIAMMGGIVGQFMKSFGLTVVYATLFSLLASFTLTPMLCALLLKKRDNRQKSKDRTFNPFHKLVEVTNNGVEFLTKEYRHVFTLIFKFPKTTVLILIVLFFSLRFIMPYIDNEFTSQTDEDKIKADIVMPQGSTIERTLGVCKIIEERIEKIPEKTSYLTSIGENGVENATITVNLVPSAERKRSDTDIIDALIPFMAQIPDAEINLARVGMHDTSTGDVSINVYGINYDKMIELAQLMKQKMEQSGYFRSVTSSYKTPKKEIQFIPDQERLIQYDVTDAQVGSTVRSSIYGNTDNVYKERGEEYDINVALNDIYAMDADDIGEITVRSTKKGLIPITELGTLKNDTALPTIWHRDKDRVIRLEGYLAKSALGYVKNVLDKEFKDLPFEDGYGYTYVGDSEYQAETNQEIGKAFLLAVILTYMLLSALLNSGMYSVPIMLSVVTSFIGVFFALFFLGQSMNIASMLGMVMLVGLVVNNAILLLDYTMLKIKEGVPVQEALWLGASVKFRAIIMTSLAIVLGVLPQLNSISPLKRSMGAVMIGGMLGSIVFTFIFTPVAFWYVDRLRSIFVKSKPATK